MTRFPQSASLEGVVSDDGKPGAPLTYLWTQVGGPGPVVIESPDQRLTRVRLPGQGVYSVRLSVSDGALTSSDDVVLTAGRAGSEVTWITAGSSWRYLDTGVDLGTAWRAPAFDDSSWKTGKGIFGYGDPNQATTLGFGPNSSGKYITTYFRRTFVAPVGAVYTNLTFKLLRDDGAIVWLNGRELYRSNMPEAPAAITYLTTASTSVGGAGR